MQHSDMLRNVRKMGCAVSQVVFIFSLPRGLQSEMILVLKGCFSAQKASGPKTAMAEGTGDSPKGNRLGSPGRSVEDYREFVHFIQRYEINQIRRSEMELCVVVHNY